MFDEKFYSLNTLVSHTIDLWPEHQRFLARRFEGESHQQLLHCEQIAADILQICGEALPDYVQGYRWMCQAINEEELHFRRHGCYRLSSFADANEQVYQNPAVMVPYLKGILLSQVLWANHAHSFEFYSTDFLQGHRGGYQHLEIGPGHGLLLSTAARDPACGKAIGWDLSPTSLEQTASACTKLGVSQQVELTLPETSASSQFDSLVLSEVLEHLEQPLKMLASLYQLTATGGRAFINVPINSPAPDHIYLFRDPLEVCSLIEQAGYQIEEMRCFPASGFSLERAKRLQTTLSCVIIAKRL